MIREAHASCETHITYDIIMGSILKFSDNFILNATFDPCFEGDRRISRFHNDHFIVTEDPQTVCFFKDYEKEAYCLWSFNLHRPLTSPALFDPVRNKIVAVVAHEEIKLFATDEGVDNCERYKFKKRIHRVLQNVNNKCEPVVLFEDGSAKLLSQAIASRSEEPNESESGVRKEEILYARTVSVNGSIEVAYFVTKGAKEHEYIRIPLDTRCISERFNIPDNCLIASIDDEGALGGMTSDADVFVIRKGNKVTASPQMPKCSVLTGISFLFFPGEKNHVALLHKLEDNSPVLTVIDVRYEISQSYAMEGSAVGAEVHDDIIFMNCHRGAIGKRYKLLPQTLSNLLSVDEEQPVPTTSKSKSKRPYDFGSMSPTTIIHMMQKKQKNGQPSATNEGQMANLLRYLIEKDPCLEANPTEQLMEQIVQTSFNPETLTKEFRSLDPPMSGEDVLQLVDKFVERTSQNDQFSKNAVDICICLLDANMSLLLQEKKQLVRMMYALYDRCDDVCEFYRSTSQVKAMVETLLGIPGPKIKFKLKDEYELHRMAI